VDTPVAGYRWACGNGTTVTGSTGTCTYGAAGTFTVQLTATDTDGLASTWSTTVTISPDSAPVVALTATPASAYVPQDVVLDASGSTDTDNAPIASYSFFCGNSTSSGVQASPRFTCSYPRSGSFTASVTVRDTLGLSASKSVSVKILADVAPTAALTATPNQISGGSGTSTLSAAGSTSVDKSPIANYRFDCGSGTYGAAQTSPTTTCSFNGVNQYTVRVLVTDTVGLSSTASTKVLVKK
jgi:hypothetical protein